MLPIGIGRTGQLRYTAASSAITRRPCRAAALRHANQATNN